MVDGKLLIEKLLIYARKFLYLSEYDVVYKRNQLLMEFKLDSPSDTPLSNNEIFEINNLSLPDNLISELETFLQESELCSNEELHKTSLFIMGMLSPLPSEVNMRFRKLREQMGAISACNYLYDISVRNNYIEKSAVLNNLSWWYTEKDNSLQVTVNMSKALDSIEKRETVQNENSSKYPSCVLCRENQGFYGNAYNPCRSNLRAVEVELGKEHWLMQYSPYCYFDEHCVIVNGKHVPMEIEPDILDKMFDFIEYIPDYFVGTNADLPLIGGSILSHEHFQGGKMKLPIFSSKPICEFKFEQYPDVEIALTDWWTCDLRISGFNRITVKEVFKMIDQEWISFSDESIGIHNSFEDGVRHNSLTAVAHYLEDGRYSVDVVLRNNYSDEEHPLGVFHVPNELQNIKKEPLGLMEVSGLFILPSRLNSEISEIVNTLSNKQEYNEEALEDVSSPIYIHRNLIKSIIAKNGFFKEARKAESVVMNYIGKACVEMLKNSSVFNLDKDGLLELKKFLAKIDIK